ncbi:MAG TPA: hypothetical protein VNW68_05755 [Candidatus Limnocylindria bacterium]|nr:hypothetical protein [Candidatus Limnocylindria bacterium]
MNWRMWMVISGVVMAVLGLVDAAGEYLGGAEYWDLWEQIGGQTADFVVDGVILPIAAVVFLVSLVMERSART